MNVDIDAYARELFKQSVQRMDQSLEELVVRLFGSVEAFAEVADDYMLEVETKYPPVRRKDERVMTFRIDTYYRIRRKTPEEKSLETEQPLLKGEQE